MLSHQKLKGYGKRLAVVASLAMGGLEQESVSGFWKWRRVRR
jgi:hypothetical protein